MTAPYMDSFYALDAERSRWPAKCWPSTTPAWRPTARGTLKSARKIVAVPFGLAGLVFLVAGSAALGAWAKIAGEDAP